MYTYPFPLFKIATLELKELNEKQRADYIENKCKLVQVKKRKHSHQWAL